MYIILYALFTTKIDVTRDLTNSMYYRYTASLNSWKFVAMSFFSRANDFDDNSSYVLKTNFSYEINFFQPIRGAVLLISHASIYRAFTTFPCVCKINIYYFIPPFYYYNSFYARFKKYYVI